MITEVKSPIADSLAGRTLRVFKVPSADGKGSYYVQIVRNRMDHAKTQGITTCNCPAGYNSIPLSIAGIKPLVCKHAELVFAFLDKVRK